MLDFKISADAEKALNQQKQHSDSHFVADSSSESESPTFRELKSYTYSQHQTKPNNFKNYYKRAPQSAFKRPSLITRVFNAWLHLFEQYIAPVISIAAKEIFSFIFFTARFLGLGLTKSVTKISRFVESKTSASKLSNGTVNGANEAAGSALAQNFTLRDTRTRLRRPIIAANVALLMLFVCIATPQSSVDPSSVAIAKSEQANEAIAVAQAASEATSKIAPTATADITTIEDIAAVEDVKLPMDVSLQLVSGDTIDKVLLDNGLDASTIATITRALRKEFNPRYLNAGQKIDLTFGEDTFGERFLTKLKIHRSVQDRVIVARADDGSYSAEKIYIPLESRPVYRWGTINSSILAAGSKAGVPQSVMQSLVDAFSYDIDFQRDVRNGDTFELLYDTLVDEDGNFVKNGKLLKATLDVRGDQKTIYRYENQKTKRSGYYRKDGTGVRKALLKTPVKYSRISSRYGMRKHPILGYNKMHTGVDFAARTGTPIRAAGDGRIVRIGWNGGYGKYIKIRHNNTYSTAYAHLSKYSSRMKKGARVKQGQIIGYVGSTGRSTGPHLHYEVLKNNRHVNPQKVKVAGGDTLKGTTLANFKKHVLKVDQQVALAKQNMKLAQLSE